MNKRIIKHYILIPAKDQSSRCVNKNWRRFARKDSLVTYLIRLLPKSLFDAVILSTDKRNVGPLDGVIIHNRSKSMATTKSPVNDLILKIIEKYDLENNGYIWLLNPTSPFRSKKDFLKILKILKDKKPSSLISCFKINPFIWKNNEPLFETGYPRKNTQDFNAEYHVENGQFIIFRIKDFLRKKTWYFDKTLLFEQKRFKTLVDIDTEEDFLEAQKLS